jgi:hypothetical protein
MVEPGEVVEGDRDGGVLLAEGRFPDGERKPVERLGISVQPLLLVEVGEVLSD